MEREIDYNALAWLNKIKIIENIEITPVQMAQVCDDILHESTNSLCKQ